jgi:hypothetical protein
MKLYDRNPVGVGTVLNGTLIEPRSPVELVPVIFAVVAV